MAEKNPDQSYADIDMKITMPGVKGPQILTIKVKAEITDIEAVLDAKADWEAILMRECPRCQDSVRRGTRCPHYEEERQPND